MLQGWECVGCGVLLSSGGGGGQFKMTNFEWVLHSFGVPYGNQVYTMSSNNGHCDNIHIANQFTNDFKCVYCITYTNIANQFTTLSFVIMRTEEFHIQITSLAMVPMISKVRYYFHVHIANEFKCMSDNVYYLIIGKNNCTAS